MNTIREEYLGHLDREFRKMSLLVTRQLDITGKHLKGEITEEMKEELKNNEDEIDRLELNLRKEIINTIGLQSPKAADLRRIIAYYDMIGNIERIADLLCGINKRLPKLANEGIIYSLYRDKTIQLYEIANKMTQNAIFAFLCEDSQMARKVIADDDQVDLLNCTIHQELFAYEEKKKSSYTMAHLLGLGRILYNMERIGDGATNISEAVIFLTEGIDIKHQNIR